ncbi:hypothetical protein [Vibrio parahaemolyticus]|uniref:hypothetical protein n=1 Tax=Vibrio parahaemolyticus TaxID=670 RepID=UPI0004A2B253|nr:hypothetical protein [Vibrio parahaemolyticus]OEB50079.1 hypothetical protein BBN06_07770 [Vibrio parahaemolyticus]
MVMKLVDIQVKDLRQPITLDYLTKRYPECFDEDKRWKLNYDEPLVIHADVVFDAEYYRKSSMPADGYWRGGNVPNVMRWFLNQVEKTGYPVDNLVAISYTRYIESNSKYKLSIDMKTFNTREPNT